MSHTASQSRKRLEIQGNIKTWSYALSSIYVALHLDILAPICRINVAMQEEIHEPVKTIKSIKEFMWIMAKLVILDEAVYNIFTSYQSKT